MSSYYSSYSTSYSAPPSEPETGPSPAGLGPYIGHVINDAYCIPHPGPKDDGNVATTTAERLKLDDVPSALHNIRTLSTLREFQGVLLSLLVYVAFMIVFMLALLHKRDPELALAFNMGVQDLLLAEEFGPEDARIYKTFFDVGSTQEFWQFMRGPLLGALDPDSSAVNPEDSRLPPREAGALYSVNYILGPIRILQIRVPGTPCSDLSESPFDAAVGPMCYRPFSSTVTQKPYGESEEFQFEFLPPSKTSMRKSRAFINNYPGKGHVFDLAVNASVAEEQLNMLEEAKFIDLATRSVTVAIVIYNPHINHMVLAKMIFEFLPGGGVRPTPNFRVLNPLMYAGSRGSTLALLDTILGVFVVFFLIQELRSLYSSGFRVYFLEDQWNFIDFLNVILFLVSAGIRLAMIGKVNQLRDVDLLARETFFAFDELSTLERVENTVFAINAVFLWFKFFKYSPFHTGSQLIVATIYESLSAMILGVTMLGVVIVGFAVGGWLAFGTDILAFSTIELASITLVLAMMGEFDLGPLFASNRFLGPVFFAVFILAVAFIVLSLFLSILDATYTSIQVHKDTIAEANHNLFVMVKSRILVKFGNYGAGVKALQDELVRYSEKKPYPLKWQRHDPALVSLLRKFEEYQLFDAYDANANNRLDAHEVSAMFLALQQTQQLQALSHVRSGAKARAVGKSVLEEATKAHRDAVAKEKEGAGEENGGGGVGVGGGGGGGARVRSVHFTPCYEKVTRKDIMTKMLFVVKRLKEVRGKVAEAGLSWKALISSEELAIAEDANVVTLLHEHAEHHAVAKETKALASGKVSKEVVSQQRETRAGHRDIRHERLKRAVTGLQQGGGGGESDTTYSYYYSDGW